MNFKLLLLFKIIANFPFTLTPAIFPPTHLRASFSEGKNVMQTSSLHSIIMYGCGSLHPLLSDAGRSFFKDDWPPGKHDLLNELSRGLTLAQTWSLNGSAPDPL